MPYQLSGGTAALTSKANAPGSGRKPASCNTVIVSFSSSDFRMDVVVSPDPDRGVNTAYYYVEPAQQ